jgi:DNA transformation protein and related proteins
MTLSAEYLAFIKDQMSGFGPVSIKRMFGGAGVSFDDVNFAIIAGEVLYLKTDAENEPDFTAEDLEPFTYEGRNGKPMQMSYRRAPPRVMDDADEMTLWCRKAFEAALRARKPRSDRKKALKGKNYGRT